MIRARIGWFLRKWADRIDPDHAFRHMGSLGLTLEKGKGWTLNQDTEFGKPRGIIPWYYGPDFDKAYDHALDPPVQIDWRTLRTKVRSRG